MTKIYLSRQSCESPSLFDHEETYNNNRFQQNFAEIAGIAGIAGIDTMPPARRSPSLPGNTSYPNPPLTPPNSFGTSGYEQHHDTPPRTSQHSICPLTTIRNEIHALEHLVAITTHLSKSFNNNFIIPAETIRRAVEPLKNLCPEVVNKQAYFFQIINDACINGMSTQVCMTIGEEFNAVLTEKRNDLKKLLKSNEI